jgi:predicted HicB family RNase H-like nuclease
VEFDAQASIFHGEVVGIRDVVTFQGRSVRELQKAFRDSVEDYLAFCQERGEEPDKACSGKFVVRVAPALHRRANAIAAAEGKSLNAWVAQAMEERAQMRVVRPPRPVRLGQRKASTRARHRPLLGAKAA